MIGASPIAVLPIAAFEAVAAGAGAYFEGRALLAGHARVSIQAGGAFQGAAALAGAGRRARFGAASLAVGSEFSVTARRVRTVGAAFAGSAGLTGSLGYVVTGGVAFAGTATLTADVNLRIYAATREFITDPADIPTNQPFLGTLQKVIRFDRSILNGGRIGQVTAGWGEMELINAEGDYDEYIDRYAVDGRPIVVKVGVVGAPYSAFQTLFEGTAADWNVEENVLRIQVRDNTYRLEVPAQPLLYAGTGGLEGTDDLKGKRKPLALGANANVTPVILIPNLGVFQVSSGRVQAIGPVYDRAVPLAFASDFSTAAALLAATTGAQGSGAQIEAGEYGTCLSAGLIRLGGANVGTVTCDVLGDKTGGVYLSTTAGIARRLIALATDIRDPAGLITASFDAVDAAQPAPVGYWLDGSGEESVADVIADLMNGVGGWGGMRRNGRFEVGIFTAPGGQPTAYYDRADIIEIERQKMPEGLSPPPWRFRHAWGRNWTVQTDVEGQSGVTPERVAFLREPYRLATSNAAMGRRILTDHPLAQDAAPVEAYFRDEADALAEADRLLALFGPTSSLYRLVIKARPFTHEIGEVAHVTFPRWDLKLGRLLRIVALTDNTDEEHVVIIGFG